MTKLISPLALLLLASLPAGAVAQDRAAEDEVRAFIVAYDKAVRERDVAFLGRALSADYVLTGASGRKFDRAQVLKYYAQERDKPSYRRIALQHDNQVVHALTSMAVITNDYTSQTAPADDLTADPETTKGRHTGVFVKRGGRWMVLAEQDTELPQDGTLIERQVSNRGREYFALTKRLADGRPYHDLVESGDLAALGRLLAEAFTCYCDNRGVTSKAKELERFKIHPIKLDSVAVLEQAVVAIDNNSAVERGTVRYFGTDGTEPIDSVTHFTRTWVSWGESWQVIAAHFSSAAQ